MDDWLAVGCFALWRGKPVKVHEISASGASVLVTPLDDPQAPRYVKRSSLGSYVTPKADNGSGMTHANTT